MIIFYLSSYTRRRLCRKHLCLVVFSCSLCFVVQVSTFLYSCSILSNYFYHNDVKNDFAIISSFVLAISDNISSFPCILCRFETGLKCLSTFIKVQGDFSLSLSLLSHRKEKCRSTRTCLQGSEQLQSRQNTQTVRTLESGRHFIHEFQHSPIVTLQK